MRKTLLALVCCFVFLNVSLAQDADLTRRINEMLAFTQQKNIEKSLDYTYPKLFKIATREQLAEAMKGVYETDEFITEFDSLYVIKIYPVFTLEGKQHVKIRHNMVMRMNFKQPLDTAGTDNEAAFLQELMSEKYGKENARIDVSKNALVIKMTPDMVGIKENNEWYFVNFDVDNPALLDMLFSKAVQKKIKEFQ